jgi:hypothetical protein
MNFEFGTVATQFLFREYLFQILGIGSLQFFTIYLSTIFDSENDSDLDIIQIFLYNIPFHGVQYRWQ